MRLAVALAVLAAVLALLAVLLGSRRPEPARLTYPAFQRAASASGFARMLAGLGRADALLPALRRAAEAGDAARARVLVRRGRALVARANLDAVAVGLSDCRRS
jgi:hypothetical protein